MNTDLGREEGEKKKKKREKKREKTFTCLFGILCFSTVNVAAEEEATLKNCVVSLYSRVSLRQKPSLDSFMCNLKTFLFPKLLICRVFRSVLLSSSV